MQRLKRTLDRSWVWLENDSDLFQEPLSLTKHSKLPLRFEQSYTNPSFLRGWDPDLLASRPLPSDYADDMNEFGRLLTRGVLGGGGGAEKTLQKRDRGL